MDAAVTQSPSQPVLSDRAAAGAKPRSRRKPFLILGAVAAVVLLGVGIYSLLSAGKVTTDDAQVDAARASLVRAQADARRAELDLNRTKQLAAVNAVSRERLDNAQAGFDSAQAAVQQAQAQLTAAEEARRGAISRVAEAQGHFQ